ncbi:creatininase [Methyloligella solikamskensis]|uniref:Creatininase n=1 Tax=Methyloligella solikamskensis TaxID=1177756 RepID=A0ABW3J5P3_9HYPH
MDEVYISEISWPVFEEKIAAGAPVFLPVGATEQHGPHLPLGVDVFLPAAVAANLARRLGGLVAPPIPYGYKSQARSGGGQQFPGTTSLSAHTLTLVVKDVIHDLGLHGARRFVIVNGHCENAWPLVEGLDLAMTELRRDGISGTKAMRLEYWDFIRPETLERLFPDGYPGIELEHASLLETSLMLLVRPDLVSPELMPDDGPAEFPPYDVTPVPKGLVPASGVLAVAQGATKESGQLLMDDYVTLISEAIAKEFDL